MKIQEKIKMHRLTRTDKVVLSKFRREAFEAKGITAVIYENSDYYFLRMSIPFDFNEKGVFGIEFGNWLAEIWAFESTAFGVELLAQVRKGCISNVLMNNPEKPFTHPDYPSLPIINPPSGELTLEM